VPGSTPGFSTTFESTKTLQVYISEEITEQNRSEVIYFSGRGSYILSRLTQPVPVSGANPDVLNF